MCFVNLRQCIGKNEEYGRGPRVSLQNPAAAAADEEDPKEDPGSPAGRGAAATAATATAASDGPLRHLHECDY